MSFWFPFWERFRHGVQELQHLLLKFFWAWLTLRLCFQLQGTLLLVLHVYVEPCGLLCLIPTAVAGIVVAIVLDFIFLLFGHIPQNL
jgi:hypothetical protein